MPRFSVIIACYNAAETLPETLAALQAQTCQDWEAICVDDGSFDATLAILKSAAANDPRIKAISQKNAGPSAARNIGVEAARSDWVAFLDADDVWLPCKLEVMKDVISDNPKAGAVFGKIAFLDDRTDRESTVSTVHSGVTPLDRILGENPVCTLSNLCARRKAFKAVGGFDVTMRHSEDLEFIIRLVARGFPLVGTDTLLMRYRASEGGLSSDLKRMHAGWRRAILSAGASVTPRQYARAEALHLRYLSRRALRLGLPGIVASKIALKGLTRAPFSFLSNGKRGTGTLLGCLAAPFMTTTLRRKLFA